MTEEIFFKSPAHRGRFLTTMQRIGKIYSGKLDEEYAAAVYILTSSLSTWNKASSYVSHDGISFDDLLEGPGFSGGYVSLIKLAGNLFNAGRTKVDPVDFVTGLDDTNFSIAISALILRRHSWSVDSF